MTDEPINAVPDFDPFAAAEAAGVAPGEDKLERLQKLVDEVEDVKSDVDYYTEELGKAEEKLKGLLRDTIPNLMEEIGMSKVTTMDGMNVEVTPKANPSIKAENKSAAYQWLKDHDFGGLIKSKITVEFGKGEEDDAAEALAALEDIGVTAGLEESIHAQTLKSWVNERLEAGEEIPETIGVHQFKEAKISVPKAKKSAKVKK